VFATPSAAINNARARGADIPSCPSISRVSKRRSVSICASGSPTTTSTRKGLLLLETLARRSQTRAGRESCLFSPTRGRSCPHRPPDSSATPRSDGVSLPQFLPQLPRRDHQRQHKNPSSAGASGHPNMQRRYLGVKWSQVQILSARLREVGAVSAELTPLPPVRPAPPSASPGHRRLLVPVAHSTEEDDANAHCRHAACPTHQGNSRHR